MHGIRRILTPFSTLIRDNFHPAKIGTTKPSSHTAMHSSRRSSNSLFSYFILTTSLLSTVFAQTTYQGCYAVDSTLVVNDTSIYQSTGRCNGEVCGKAGYAVFGLTSGSQCWCGNSIPANQVTSDHCSLTCPGYPADTCTVSTKAED